MATPGSAAGAVEAPRLALAGSVLVEDGDSLVAPSGSSLSYWRRRLLCCSVVRSGACRCCNVLVELKRSSGFYFARELAAAKPKCMARGSGLAWPG